MEDIPFYIVVEGLFTDIELRVSLKDGVGRLSLPEERTDYISDLFCFFGSEVHSYTRVNKKSAVILIGVFGAVPEFIKTAPAPVRAAIARSGRPVPSAADKRDVIGASGDTLPAMDTFFVGITFHRKTAFNLKDPVVFDLLTDRRVVLAKSFSNGGFGRSVADTCLDYPSFFEREMFVCI